MTTSRPVCMTKPPKSVHRKLSLEQIVDSLPGQVAYWDRNLICGYANRAYSEWFSQSPDALVGIGMRDLLGADLFQKNQAHIDGILQGEPQSFVRPIHKLDGSAAKVHVKYVPNCDADGAVVGFYVSVNDVTAFKAIEEQLRQKETELTALVARREEAISWLKMAEEVANVGHWRLSLPQGALTWSDEMYRIHGVTSDCYHPDPETALSFYCSEDRTRVRGLIERAVSEGLPFEDMGRLVRRNGDVRYVKTRGMAAQGTAGSAVTIFGVYVDVTDQQRTEHALRVANDRLQAMAHVDGLTGINNRRRFDEAFDAEWRAAARNGHALSIVLIDVDHFKSYNDTYGHQSGDECLRAVALALQTVACRPIDIVARYGGEEFALMLPATDRTAATKVAERARAAVEGLGREHKGSVSGVLTISAGIGSIRSIRFDLDVQRQLIAEADAMLYRAKSMGRNMVVSSGEMGEAERINLA